MHAERLHSIVNKIIDDYNNINYISHMDGLINAVQNRIKEPTNPQFDEQVSTAVKNLFESLKASETNEFSPTWQKILHELDLEILLTETIRNEVDRVLKRRIVDSDVIGGLSALKSAIEQKYSALTQIQTGFKAIGLKDDELEPEEVELNFAMPRESIDDQLDGFKKELDDLNKQLLVFLNISKTKIPEFKITNISTNDFSLSLNINIDLGEILLFCLIYLHMARAELKSKTDALEQNFSDLPINLYKQFQKWANETVEKNITQIITDIGKGCKEAVDKKQLEAQEKPLRVALQYLAVKLENGFNIDVRAGEPPEDDIAEGEDGTKQTPELIARRARLKAITTKSAELKVLERQSSPILSLPPTSRQEELKEEQTDDEEVGEPSSE